MLSGDVGVHILQARVSHCFLQREILLATIGFLFWVITHYMHLEPMVEPPQGPPGAGGHHLL